MAKSLKTQGRVELNQLLQRARRQYAMRRIAKQDLDYIEKRLLEVDQRIQQMKEVNEKGKELSATKDTPEDQQRQGSSQHD